MAELPREELEAAVEARRELGPDHEREVVASFLDRIETEIERRVDERVARHGRSLEPRHVESGQRTGLAIASIFAGVGTTAIATGNDQPWVAVVAWIAIAVVNVLYSRRST